jgi:hypothetical protein
MRSVLPVAILVLTSFVLAGCSGGGDDDDLHYVCANGTEIHSDDHPEANATKADDLAKFCPGSSTSKSGSKSNSTASKPNVLPNLVLKITNDTGAETPIILLDGNLTFDATGSTDSDGTVAGIAVTVTDSNTTRTATLYDAGKKQFKPATFKFDRPGVVNVTVAMVDDRAGFTVNQTKVYVNHPQNNVNGVVQVPSNGAVPSDAGDPCVGAGNTLIDSAYFKTVSIMVAQNATKIEVTSVDPAALMTICSPEDTVLSAVKAKGFVETTAGIALPPPAGITSYKVGMFSADKPQMSTEVNIVVHYEPQAAAAA